MWKIILKQINHDKKEEYISEIGLETLQQYCISKCP